MKHNLLNGDELLDAHTGVTTMLVTNAKLVAGRVKVLNLASDSEKFIPYEDLRQRIASGELTIKRKGDALVHAARQNNTALDEAVQRALHLAREVQRLVASRRISARQAYLCLKEKHLDNPECPLTFPSRATVYRHLKRLRQGLPVLVGDKNKGNRTPRRSEQLCNLVCQAAERHMLEPMSRWSVHSLTAYANQLAHSAALLSPGDSMSKKFVRKVIFENLSTDMELERMDPRTASAAKSTAKQSIRVAMPLARVEQDAVHLPWLVRTPTGDTKELYLVYAIDCATGMPVGWHLVVGAPTVGDTLKCLEFVLFSNAARFKELGITSDKDCYGTPSLLVLDNGPETKGERVQKLSHLGIDVMYCKSRQPPGQALHRAAESLAQREAGDPAGLHTL
jgi:putative transposase